MTDTAKTIGELTPATNVCFAVQARRGELASPVLGEGVCRRPWPRSRPSARHRPGSVELRPGERVAVGGRRISAGVVAVPVAAGGGGSPATSASSVRTDGLRRPRPLGSRRRAATPSPNAELQGQVVRDRVLAGAGNRLRRGGQAGQAQGAGPACGSRQEHGVREPRCPASRWRAGCSISARSTRRRTRTAACVTVRKVHPDCLGGPARPVRARRSSTSADRRPGAQGDLGEPEHLLRAGGLVRWEGASGPRSAPSRPEPRCRARRVCWSHVLPACHPRTESAYAIQIFSGRNCSRRFGLFVEQPCPQVDLADPGRGRTTAGSPRVVGVALHGLPWVEDGPVHLPRLGRAVDQRVRRRVRGRGLRRDDLRASLPVRGRGCCVRRSSGPGRTPWVIARRR